MPMDTTQRIRAHFAESAELKLAAVNVLAPLIARAAGLMTECLLGDGKLLAETGLDKPEATLTIQLKDNAGKYDLLVGKTATGTNRWAKRADDDAIYQITNYNSEWLVSDTSKYQSAADAGAPDGGGKKK